MKTIESFRVNHLTLKSGLYVSRKDRHDGVTATTFDLRMINPYVDPFLTVRAIHTIEHLGATFLRNSPLADRVVYFGPMGCRTGFYLVLFGDLSSEDVYDTVVEMCSFITAFEGAVPGATKAQCGNWRSHDLAGAKRAAAKYVKELTAYRRFSYEKE